MRFRDFSIKMSAVRRLVFKTEIFNSYAFGRYVLHDLDKFCGDKVVRLKLTLYICVVLLAAAAAQNHNKRGACVAASLCSRDDRSRA